MSDSQFKEEREVAIEAARAAARLCDDVQSKLNEGVMKKSDRTPVTIADFGSQALICKVLRDEFGDDPVMAEEDSSALQEQDNATVLDKVTTHVQNAWPEALKKDICAWIDHGNANTYSNRFWTVDPIDGTKGFVRGDQYAIALALIVQGEVVVSVLGCPNLSIERAEMGDGVLLVAEKNAGAWQMPLNGDWDDAKKISVSLTDDPADARFCESFVSAHSSRGKTARAAEALNITREPLRIDSQAKYAVVARGEVDLYLRLPRGDYIERIWDHAAGMLLVEEAGGTVSDMHGAPLEFTYGRKLEENEGIVASNGILHQQMLEALKMVKQDEQKA